MGKFFLTFLLTFLLLFGSIFFIPINFIVSNVLKNSDLNIEYSYLEGNIFSGEVLDLYYDNNFIGDFRYENQFSIDNVTANFISAPVDLPIQFFCIIFTFSGHKVN